MLFIICDIVSCVGMIAYLLGLLCMLFGWQAPRKYFEKHPIIKNIYGILLVIGFIRFALAIPSLV